MIRISPVTSKALWEGYLNSRKPHTFLQSWNWGEFNLQMGSKIWRLGIFEGDELRGVALIVKVQARRGSFLLSPHGPLLDSPRAEHIGSLLDYLKELSQKERALFIRLCPIFEKSQANIEMFRRLGFRNSPIHTTPELVWILDLAPSAEELFAEMRKQTRYSVRKAEKDGVSVAASARPEDVENFYALYQATVERQHFVPFSKEFIRKEFEMFSKDGNALFFFAKYRGENVSGALIIFSNAGAFYHQGASLVKYPQLTASHLLQWEVIREAKRRGCGFYNFWGIAPEEAKSHPWAGLSLFKRGFGGRSEEYVPSQDYALSKGYWLTYAVEKLRKIKRGF